MIFQTLITCNARLPLSIRIVLPLSEAERRLYKEDALRKDTIQRNIKPKSKSQVFWGQVGDVLISDYKLNLSNLGSVKCSPLINPFLLSYSGSNGLSYRQSFKYNRLFKHDRLLRVVPKLGYNFTRKEFYWSVNTEFNYLPEKMGAVHIDFGNGNRIYSSDVLDDLKAIPDSVFDFNQIHLDYFYDLYFNFRHSIEIINGLELSVGLSTHRRKAVKSSKLVPLTKSRETLNEDIQNKIRNTYLSFAPRVRLEWTPCLYYYMNGHRKINLRSKYPTFSIDWERGIKGVFGSTGQYERLEFDLQHHIPLGLMRNIIVLDLVCLPIRKKCILSTLITLPEVIFLKVGMTKSEEYFSFSTVVGIMLHGNIYGDILLMKLLSYY